MSADAEMEQVSEQPPFPPTEARPARLRLEELLGRDFTQQLLGALAPAADQGRRGSSSP
jgi:hypothetical protein